MPILTKALIALIAFEHFLILYIEMFAWESLGKKIFKTVPENLFGPTKGMMANQGLYNGFLAAGLIWPFFIANQKWANSITTFFLICVVIAGTFGAVTSSRKIFFIQALPAIVALVMINWIG